MAEGVIADGNAGDRRLGGGAGPQVSAESLELQWDVKETVKHRKHRQNEPGLVMTKAYEPKPSLSHFKSDKQAIDGVFSNNAKGTKHMSHDEKDSAESLDMKGEMGRDISLTAEKSSSSHTLDGEELPLLLYSIKQESKVQEGKGESEVKPTNSHTSLPFLSPVNLQSRTEASKDKPRMLQSCLMLQKCQASSIVKRVTFAEVANQENLCPALESMCLLPKKKKARKNIVDANSIMDLTCILLQRKNSPFRQLLHGKKLKWDSKEQENMKEKAKSHLAVAQNESWDSFLPSPHMEWGPRMKKVYMQGVTRFCLPPLTFQELSETTYKEPDDGILSSLKRAKYMPQNDRMQTDSEKIIPSQRISLRTNQSSVSQKLQMNVQEKEKITQEDKHVEIWGKSFIALPPCSEVGARQKGNEAMQIKARPSFLQPRSQKSLETGKIAYEEFISDTVSYCAKRIIDQVTQREKKSKKVENITLKTVLQNGQLDTKQQEEKPKKMKDEPTVANTSIGIPSLHLKLDTGTEKACYIMEVTRGFLLELLQQKSSDTVQGVSRDSTEGNFTTATQKVKERIPQKEENKVKILTEKVIEEEEDGEGEGEKEREEEEEKDGFTTDRNNKMLPKPVDPKVKKSPLTHPLSVQESPWKTEELSRKMQEDKNELMTELTNRITKLCSQWPPNESSDAGTAAPSKRTDADVSNDRKELKKHRTQEERKRVEIVTTSNAREAIPTESAGGGLMKDVKTKSDLPQKEERDRQHIDRRGTDITLKSKKFSPSSKLYKTELQMRISGHKGKDEQGKRRRIMILRKSNASEPSPLSLKLHKGKSIDEERLESKTSSLLPVPLSALSEAKEIADRETVNDHVRKKKPIYVTARKKGVRQRWVALRIGVHCQVPRSSPMWHILNAKEWILDLKVLESRMHKDRGDSCKLVTRSFVSVSPMPLINLDSRNNANKATAAITESSSARQRGQSSHVQKSRVQKRANQESAKGDGKKLVKRAEHYVPRKNEEQLRTSNFMVTAQQSTAPPHTESGRDAHSQHENVYSTKSAIRSGERLELPFPGQKSQPEKHEENPFATFNSLPTRDATEIGNLKKESQIIDNLKQTINPKVSVSPPRETFQETQAVLASSKGFSVPEMGDRGSLQKELEKEESLLELVQKTLHLLQAFLHQSGHLEETDEKNTNISTSMEQKKLEKDNNSVVDHEEKIMSHKTLNHISPEEKNKLTNQLEPKAVGIKMNLIPEMAKKSIQNFSFYLKLATFEKYQWKLYPRLEKKNEFPSWSPSLQMYSAEEKDKLLMHFSMKILEIKMHAFSRIVRESYAMASVQKKMKLLPDCIHFAVKVPKQKNRILLLFDEKSLHELDLNLQHKYLHYLLGSSAESTFPKLNAFPKHIHDLNTTCLYKKADDSGANCSLPCDTELLQEHITFKEQCSHEDSLLSRRRLEPAPGCTFDPGPQRSQVQEGTSVLSGLKSHGILDKHKQYQVSFQETNTHKPFHINTQKNATGLGDSQSRKISDHFTEIQKGTENSAMLEKCMAPKVGDSDESVFLEANSNLSPESQKILYDVQNGTPFTNLFTFKDILPYLKSFSSKDSCSPHVRACRKHSVAMTPPSCESHRRRSCRSLSKMHSSDSDSSSDTPDTQSTSSTEEIMLWTTSSEASCYLPDIKIHVAKNQNKPFTYPESKERKKPRSNLPRKKNMHWDYNPHFCHTHKKEKSSRKNKACDYELKRSDYFYSQRKHKSTSKPHHEEIHYHPGKKQSKPFIYACIITESMNVTPKMIRWNIPKNILKTNCRVPQVAKMSLTWNMRRLVRNLGLF
nr:LOW QUALITY PROTEIN: coiled-coil domain-containing protein 168 [Cavia porcellus]